MIYLKQNYGLALARPDRKKMPFSGGILAQGPGSKTDK